MKKYRIRKGSPLHVLGIVAAILAVFTAFSAAAADDMAEYKTAYEPAEEPVPCAVVCEEVNTEPELISLGEYKITYYCKENYPHICNNGDATKTATGTTPTAGRTIAVDPSVIPYGTEVVINNHTYVAEDCGGAIKDKKIDILVETHQEAWDLGADYYEVFVKAGDL